MTSNVVSKSHGSRGSFADRALALVVSPDGDPRVSRTLDTLQLFIGFHVVVRTLHWAGFGVPTLGLVFAFVVTVAFAASLRPGLGVRGTRALAMLMGLKLVAAFPHAPNHLLLEALVLGLLSLRSVDEPDHERLVLAGLRWTTVLVIFATGVQKALHGTYFRGQFLAYQAASSERFSDFFAWVVPAEEMARLSAIAAAGTMTGSGPYFATTPGLLFMANATWVFELVLPALLVWRRTRELAVLAGAVFFLTLQLGAHELFFGVLITTLALSISRRDHRRWLLPLVVALYSALLLSAAGVGPHFEFN